MDKDTKKSYKVDITRKTIHKKVEQLEKVKKELKNYKTVALIDLRKLPDALLQTIRKKLRNDGKIFVLKKPVIQRLMESEKKLAPFAKECDKPVALLLTNFSPFELNKFFKENKKQRAAKIGEIAPFDIIIPEGETDIPPGPALSELKSAGINVQIKAGKIIVAKESTVAKTGDALTDLKVKAMQKLNIMPFEVSVKMIFGYDGHYIYNVELLNIDDTLNADLQHSLSDAFNLSINAKYPTKQNVDTLLRDAYLQSVNLSLNGDLYSSSTIGQLLTSAVRQGMALGSLG